MTAWSFLGYILSITGGFLLGGIMFSQILPEKILHKDIQAISEDHNPGATNVFVNCGTAMGLTCLVLDLLKGMIPVLLAGYLLDRKNLLFGIILAAPVLGHAVAPFHHFHGGKCIATSFGEMIGLLPFNRIGLLLAGLYIIFSTVIKIQPNRVRSIVVYSLFGLSSSILLTAREENSIALGCILISLIAIFKHSRYFIRNK